jgi:hypothetical protein
MSQTIMTFDEVNLTIEMNIHSVATRRMSGLDTEDLMDYLEHHARQAVNSALIELQIGNKTLEELGFT